MKNKWFAFIRIFENESYIESSGISFNEFYNGINEKPRNILVLKGHPNNTAFNYEHLFHYITSENVVEFTKSNVYDYGDFCWVDFTNSKHLNDLSNKQLAELLFFAHKAKPLLSHYFSDLDNKYSYCSHDDEWFVRVFMEETKNYLSVIAYKLLTELKGRKKHISPLPDAILGYIYNLAKDGIIIDFENSFTTGVMIYKAGSVDNLDYIHKALDKCRKNLFGLCLSYNSKSHKWRLI